MTQGTPQGEIHGETTGPPNPSHDGSIQLIHVKDHWESTIGCGPGDSATTSAFKGFVGDQPQGCGKETYSPDPVPNVCDGSGGYPKGTYSAGGAGGDTCVSECLVSAALLTPFACPTYTATGKCNGLPPTAEIFPVVSQISGGPQAYSFTVSEYAAAVVTDDSPNNTTVQIVFICQDLPGNPSTFNHCNVPTNEQAVFGAFLH